DDYLRFWRAFGPIVKEGIVLDAEHAREVASLALFPSSAGDDLATLDQYVARMPAGQASIYVLGGHDGAARRRSPPLERPAAGGLEALFLIDPVDEWVQTSLHEYQGKPLVAIDRGEVDFDDEAAKLEREQQERESRALLERLERELSGRVTAVRFSSR